MAAMVEAIVGTLRERWNSFFSGDFAVSRGHARFVQPAKATDIK